MDEGWELYCLYISAGLLDTRWDAFREPLGQCQHIRQFMDGLAYCTKEIGHEEDTVERFDSAPALSCAMHEKKKKRRDEKNGRNQCDEWNSEMV